MRDTRSWIPTFTGKRFWPLDPNMGDVDIRDIAHHLSNICRFTGAVRQHYSVAQHSVLVSKNTPQQDALWGLLHDATEAYMNDMSRPLKRHQFLRLYRVAEDRLLDCIASRFGLPGVMPESVHIEDARAFCTEVRDVLPSCWGEFAFNDPDVSGQPWPETIEIWSPEKSEQLFLMRYEELTGTRV